MTTLTMTPQIHPVLAGRRSTRAFDRDAVLPADAAARLLEAARWTASGGNSQPWRFVLAAKGTLEHAALLSALADGNRLWAGDASALLLAAAVTTNPEGRANPWASYDLGQAVAQLVVQAESEGYAVHQMGGFDPEVVRVAFDLADELQPFVIAAIGTPGSADHLPTFLVERETAVRTRMPVEELLIA